MKIFYSWQSDLPNNTNRGFILDALEKAAKAIRQDETLEVEPVIDRDTSGVPGAPNIAQTILDKIERSAIFVADVSIINPNETGRKTPNPNVLLELGYAWKCLGSSAIILIQNTAYGGPELLPFDLRMSRVVSYSLTENNDGKSATKNDLWKTLEKAIRLIIAEIGESHQAPQTPVDKEILRILSANNKIELNSYLTDRATALVKQFKQSPLMDISTQPSTDELVRRVDIVDSALDDMVRIFTAAAPWAEGEQFVPFGRVIERLTSYGVPANGTHYKSWQTFQNYPALRLFYAGGMSALANNNYLFIEHLATMNKYYDRYKDKHVPMINELNAPLVFSDKLGNLFPDKLRHFTPASDYLHDSLKEYFVDGIVTDTDYTRLFDRFEFLVAMIFGRKRLEESDRSWFWAPLGSFLWRGRGDIRNRIAREIIEDESEWKGIKVGLFVSKEQVQVVINEIQNLASQSEGGR